MEFSPPETSGFTVRNVFTASANFTTSGIDQITNVFGTPEPTTVSLVSIGLIVLAVRADIDCRACMRFYERTAGQTGDVRMARAAESMMSSNGSREIVFDRCGDGVHFNCQTSVKLERFQTLWPAVI
jgi:hypothetical protein